MTNSFLFAGLARLPRESSGNLDGDAVRSLQLPMPDDVLEQLVLDHGNKPEFLAQYGHVDLWTLDWALEATLASTLMGATIYPRFARWVDSVDRRSQGVQSGSWREFDTRAEVVSHWKTERTWMRPPVFIERRVFEPHDGLHLMEGHTRFGALRSLLRQGVIHPDSTHLVWRGHAKASG